MAETQTIFQDNIQLNL